MEESSQNTYPNIQPSTPQENHGVNYIVVFAIVVFLIIVSYVLYTNTDILQNKEEVVERYSQEEKLEILESLAAEPEPEDILTGEDKETMLEEMTSSAIEYSEEEKRELLYSMQ